MSFPPKPGADLPLSPSAASLEVARRLFSQGQWAKAAEAFLRAGATRSAAESWERAGELKRAADLYERHFADTSATGQAGGPDRNAALRAGQLYARGGDPDRAVEVLLRGGHVLAAASLHESRQSWAAAAELYARVDAHDKAADCWGRAGEPLKAALARGEAALVAERPAEAAVHFLEGRERHINAELSRIETALKGIEIKVDGSVDHHHTHTILTPQLAQELVNARREALATRGN